MVRNVKFDTVKFAQQLGISDTVAKLMVNRGIYNLDIAKEYLSSSIGELHNPTDMLGMSGAVELMRNSIIKGEKILIVGDYDVDGVISTYVLYIAISKCGGNVSFHIPDRIKEGYGINESIIKKASEDNIDIIITCDNGIAAIEQVKLAKELGIKVIITDHHDVPFIEEDNVRKYVVPEADYVLNPKQENCNYEFDKICGAGVAYKFVQCLYKEFNIPNEELYDLIQYVAIATVCDVVDLVSENRILVKEGLKRINNTSNIGLRALFKETGLEGKEITVYSLGFVIGPSINASGRLEQAEWALKLLITKDKNEAEELAKKLNELNKDRQELTQTGLEEAIKIIEENNMAKDKVLVVYLEDVHESIAGIIAGRIKDRLNHPAFVLTDAKEGIKGSGRSIEGYSMFEEMMKVKEVFTKFGGHPMAAGCSLKKEKLQEFRKKINENCTLEKKDFAKKVQIDIDMPVDYITMDLIHQLSVLEPFGKENKKPLFAHRKLKVERVNVFGKNRNVIKLALKSSQGTRIDGMIFEDEDEFREKMGTSKYITCTYYPVINEYQGYKSLQINIQNYFFVEE